MNRSLARLRHLYYGWWTVLASALFMMYHAGTWWYGFGVLFTPLTAEFGWGRAATSLAFSLSSLEGGFLAPLVGWGVDRFGPRKLILLGVAIFVVGHVLLSQIDSLASFLVVYVLVIGIGAQTCGMNVHMANVARWFQRYRSRAMGLVSVGAALGAVILTPLLAWFIVTYTWRGAVLAIAAGMLLVGIPAAFALRPHPPEHYGLFPDGSTPGAGAPQAASLPQGEESGALDFTPRQALKTRSFWMLTVAWALGSSTFSAVSVHLVPLLQDRGVPLQLAATGIAFLNLVTIPSRLLIAWLADAVDVRYVYGMSAALQTIGILAILLAPTELWIYGAVALFGFGSGGATLLRPTMVGAYFGRRRFGSIQGWMFAFAMPFSMMAPLLMGLAFDLTGDYTAALAGLTLASAVGLPLVFLAGRARRSFAVAPSPLQEVSS